MNFHNYSYYTNLLYGGSNADNQSLTGDYDATSQFVTPCQIPVQQEPSTKQKHRVHDFTIEEDNLLVFAWLNISMDAVHGNEQKSGRYWDRVAEYFHTYKKFNSNRNGSLMHRWLTIQLAVNKFCGYFAQIESRQQSGRNEQDKVLLL